MVIVTSLTVSVFKCADSLDVFKTSEAIELFCGVYSDLPVQKDGVLPRILPAVEDRKLAIAGAALSLYAACSGS